MNELGINLSFAVKRWPEPEAWAEFVRSRLGLRLVQFSYDLLDPWWPDEIAGPLIRRVRSSLEENELELHSAFVGLAGYTYNGLLHPEPEGRAAGRRLFRRALEIAAELGAKAFGGPVGGMSVRQAADKRSREARYRELIETLAELSEDARRFGLQELLIEPTPLEREVPWSIAQAKQLAVELEERCAVPVRFAIDLGHALYRPLYGRAADYRPWLHELADHVGLLHLQQTDGLSDSHWGFTRAGVVELGEVASETERAGLGQIPMFLEVFYPFELNDREVELDIVASVEDAKRQIAAPEGIPKLTRKR